MYIAHITIESKDVVIMTTMAFYGAYLTDIGCKQCYLCGAVFVHHHHCHHRTIVWFRCIHNVFHLPYSTQFFYISNCVKFDRRKRQHTMELPQHMTSMGEASAHVYTDFARQCMHRITPDRGWHRFLLQRERAALNNEKDEYKRQLQRSCIGKIHAFTGMLGIASIYIDMLEALRLQRMRHHLQCRHAGTDYLMIDASTLTLESISVDEYMRRTNKAFGMNGDWEHDDQWWRHETLRDSAKLARALLTELESVKTDL